MRAISFVARRLAGLSGDEWSVLPRGVQDIIDFVGIRLLPVVLADVEELARTHANGKALRASKVIPTASGRRFVLVFAGRRDDRDALGHTTLIFELRRLDSSSIREESP